MSAPLSSYLGQYDADREEDRRRRHSAASRLVAVVDGEAAKKRDVFMARESGGPVHAS